MEQSSAVGRGRTASPQIEVPESSRCHQPTAGQFGVTPYVEPTSLLRPTTLIRDTCYAARPGPARTIGDKPDT